MFVIGKLTEVEADGSARWLRELELARFRGGWWLPRKLQSRLGPPQRVRPSLTIVASAGSGELADPVYEDLLDWCRSVKIWRERTIRREAPILGPSHSGSVTEDTRHLRGTEEAVRNQHAR